MYLRSLFPLVLAVVCAPLLSAADVELPKKENFQIFILAGQSNMAGRGKVDAPGKTPEPRIFAINKENQWQPAVDPLHWDKGAAGTGVGKPFAAILTAANPNISIGLVPTACGGSPISTWEPGKSWGQTKSNPYDDCMVRAKRALQDGTLKGILWHQGEADSNLRDAPLHEERLEALINRFRKDLDAPDLPFVIGQLGRFEGAPWNEYKEKVDAAQRAVAKKMKNVRFVPAENMTSADKLHYDTPSLRIFAKGYADAYLSIIGGKP